MTGASVAAPCDAATTASASARSACAGPALTMLRTPLARERAGDARVSLDAVALVGRRIAGAGMDRDGSARGSELGAELRQPHGIDTHR